MQTIDDELNEDLAAIDASFGALAVEPNIPDRSRDERAQHLEQLRTA